VRRRYGEVEGKDHNVFGVWCFWGRRPDWAGCAWLLVLLNGAAREREHSLEHFFAGRIEGPLGDVAHGGRDIYHFSCSP